MENSFNIAMHNIEQIRISLGTRTLEINDLSWVPGETMSTEAYVRTLSAIGKLL